MDAKTRRKLLKVLDHMKSRCYDETDRRYSDWGGRGITICREWLDDADAFLRWAENSGYKPGLTLDRKNNDEGYSPDNCRWVTIAENNQNRRSSRFYTINGETKNLQQWCNEYSVSRSMVNKRLEMGWDILRALTAPKRGRSVDALIGRKFGWLSVISYAGVDNNRQTLYQCKCDCGRIYITTGNKLLTGHTRSCGCMKYKMRNLPPEN